LKVIKAIIIITFSFRTSQLYCTSHYTIKFNAALACYWGSFFFRGPFPNTCGRSCLDNPLPNVPPYGIDGMPYWNGLERLRCPLLRLHLHV